MSSKYYTKVDHPERACVICGKMFKPKRCTARTCGSSRCRSRLAAEQRKEWAKANQAAIRDRKRNYKPPMHSDECYELPEEPKPRRKSNIVAIGYAERQIARSLELAGKVRTEL